MGEASPLRIERKAGSRQAVAPSAWNEDIELTRCAWVCSSPGKSPSRHPDARCYEQGRTSRAVQPAFSRGAVSGGPATAGRERGPRGGASGGGEPVQRWSRAAPASRSLSRAPAPAARPSQSRRFSPASRPPRGGAATMRQRAESVSRGGKLMDGSSVPAVAGGPRSPTCARQRA